MQPQHLVREFLDRIEGGGGTRLPRPVEATATKAAVPADAAGAANDATAATPDEILLTSSAQGQFGAVAERPAVPVPALPAGVGEASKPVIDIPGTDQRGRLERTVQGTALSIDEGGHKSQQPYTEAHYKVEGQESYVVSSDKPTLKPEDAARALCREFGPQATMDMVISSRGGEDNAPSSPPERANDLKRIRESLGMKDDPSPEFLRDVDHFVNMVIGVQAEAQDGSLTSAARRLVQAPVGAVMTVGYSAVKGLGQATEGLTGVDPLALVTQGAWKSNSAGASKASLSEVAAGLSGVVDGLVHNYPVKEDVRISLEKERMDLRFKYDRAGSPNG